MYECLGFRYVDMDDGGKKIQGYSCFFAVDENDASLEGRSACKVFFSDEKFPNFEPQVGQKYIVNFNQKGKLQGYTVVDD